MDYKNWKIRFVYTGWIACSVLLFVKEAIGHGRLVEPPSRSSAWRFGFKTPDNVQDHEIYCGGFARQWSTNSGKCGPCGDAWDLPVPRPNEGGGTYGQGVVVRTYRKGAEIELGVELTANHYGHFEFRLCPTDDPKKPETNECFDQYVLQRADGDGEKWPPGPGSNIVFKPVYRLPENLICLNCVLQWRYIAGNNWGICPDGTGKLGCGSQEEFRACADITITEDGLPDNTTTTVAPTTKATTTRVPLTGRPRPPYVPPPRRSSTTTTTTPSTTTTTTTTTSTTAATTAVVITEKPVETSAIPGVTEGIDHMPNLAPYVAGLVILGALLFTLLFFLCIILYFYHGHAHVKAFIKRNGKGQGFNIPEALTSLYRPSPKKQQGKPSAPSEQVEPPPPVTISHSVMSVPLQAKSTAAAAPSLPQNPTVVKLSHSTSGAKRRDAPEPPPRNPTTILTSSVSDGVIVNNCVQKLHMAISEPMNVAINGVNVHRDSHLEVTDIYVPPNQFYSGDSSV